MALNPCPDCSNMVSSTAKTCPKCGYDLTIKITENFQETENYINTKQEQNKKNIGTILIVVLVMFFLLILVVSQCSTDNATKVRETNNIEQVPIIEPAKEKTKEEFAIEYLKEVESEIALIKKGVDFSIYRGSIPKLEEELLLFENWAKLINKAKAFDYDVSKLNEFERLVKDIQNKEFPILRKEYANESANKLWEHDIYITCSSSRNTNINITGGIFASNQNIKGFQEEILHVLLKFRFTQANYRWYKDASEYTSYKLYRGKDSDI